MAVNEERWLVLVADDGLQKASTAAVAQAMARRGRTLLSMNRPWRFAPPRFAAAAKPQRQTAATANWGGLGPLVCQSLFAIDLPSGGREG